MGAVVQRAEGPSEIDEEFAELREVIDAVVDELYALMAMATRMQDATAPLLASITPEQRHDAAELQELDVLTQRLEGLGDFARALCGDLSPEWRINPHRSAAHVRLADLAGRLSLQTHMVVSEIPADDCDFF